MKELTPKLKTFYEQIEAVEKNAPTEMLILQAMVSIGFVSTLQRLKVQTRLIEGNPSTRPMNIFAMIIADSGVGKDRTWGFFKKSFGKILSRSIDKYKKWVEQEKEDLAEISKKKYKREAEQMAYVTKNTPPMATFIMRNATPEGYLFNRSLLERAGFGAILYHHSEFASVFENGNKSTDELLTLLKETHDEGDSGGKSTKTVAPIASVSGVPISMMVYSAPIDTTNTEAQNKFLSFLNEGFARRTYFCLPKSIPTDKDLTLDEKLVLNEEKRKVFTWFGEQLETVYNAFNNVEFSIITFTKGAEEVLYEYQQENEEKREALIGGSIKRRILRQELGDRAWRTIRLAGLVAVFEHPNERGVLGEDVRAAIAITELFSKQLSHILITGEDSGESLFFDLILGKKGCTIKHGELYNHYRDLKLPRKTKNEIDNFMEMYLPGAATYAEQEGYTLKIEGTVKGGGRQYSLEKI